jgi:hypothetical protein
MKHYIGEIETYFGESEVTTTIKFKTAGNPEEYLDKIASTFWGDREVYDDSELYDFGDKSTCSGRLQEISKELYEALQITTEL